MNGEPEAQPENTANCELERRRSAAELILNSSTNPMDTFSV